MATGIRESAYIYPLVEGSHAMGLALSVGTVLWFDLRLLGIAMRRDSLTNVDDQVKPWMFLGFAVMFITGALLFASRAVDAYQSTYFRIKLGLLVLGAISLVLGFAIIAAGRIMAYNL